MRSQMGNHLSDGESILSVTTVSMVLMYTAIFVCILVIYPFILLFLPSSSLATLAHSLDFPINTLRVSATFDLKSIDWWGRVVSRALSLAQIDWVCNLNKVVVIWEVRVVHHQAVYLSSRWLVQSQVHRSRTASVLPPRRLPSIS
jgi:hypothetical protein